MLMADTTNKRRSNREQKMVINNGEQKTGINIDANQLAELTKLVVKSFQNDPQLGSRDFRIESMKQLRQVTGLSLKETKDLVEAALPQEEPVLRVARQVCHNWSASRSG